jgi:5-methylcytosine-specific restriction endonuclease McrA
VYSCATCGRQFQKQSGRRVGSRTFCTFDCFKAAPRTPRHPKAEVTCSGCGKRLLVWPSKLRLNQHFYCCPACRQRHIIGPNNPSFRSGWGRRGHYGQDWKAQRRAALGRDGQTCRHCHAQPKRSRDLHVHHLTPAYLFGGDWRRANELSNLITLCRSCHHAVEKRGLAVQLALL